MSIRICRQCGKMFTFIRSPFCGNCLDSIDQQYQIVRDYLDDHPRASISEVTRETNVSERIVLFLIREGRLSLETRLLQCERCKAAIDNGRFCPGCLTLLQNGLNKIQEASQSVQGVRIKQDGSRLSPSQRTDAAGSVDEPDHGMHINRRKR